MGNFYAEYENFLLSKNSSANTRESYLRDIQTFLKYLKSVNVECTDVDEKITGEFVVFLKEKGKSDSTVNRAISSVRGFYKFLISNGVMDFNPAKSAKTTKAPEKLPKILSSSEMECLLSMPLLTEAKGCRDKAMLELLYSSGIRVSELINIDIDHVDLHKSVIKIECKKGYRTVKINANTIVYITDYIFRTRSQLVQNQSSDALFVNLNGNRLTRQGFWKILKDYAEKANIKTELTPHTLRHSLAFHLLANGMDKSELKNIMGYADIASTQIYTKILEKHENT